MTGTPAAERRTARTRLLWGGGLALLSWASLAAWARMPVYPDEIAFRMMTGRFFQDHGLVRGVLPLCDSNFKDTPLFFTLPAAVLSRLDLAVSPAGARAFPVLIVLAAVFLAIAFAVRGRNPAGAAIAVTAFIGVAGSGLVLARHETLAELNIAACLAAVLFLTSGARGAGPRRTLSAVLLVSALFSLYVHIQGILFLPLTLYLVWHLLRPELGERRGALLSAALLAVLSAATIGFHHRTCQAYPEVDRFMARMTFTREDLASVTVTGWLAGKSERYLESFQYNDRYTVDYLPGVAAEAGWPGRGLAALNGSVRLIVLLNLLLTVLVAAGSALHAGRTFAHRRRPGEGADTSEWEGAAVALFLAATPLIFLFLYDSVNNFYRSFYLNFQAALLLSLFLSRTARPRLRRFLPFYGGLCVAAVLACLAVNRAEFTLKLSEGYTGPSLPLGTDWKGERRTVNELAKACGMDLKKGGIIVDDRTYDGLKRYPALTPATYVGLCAEVAGMKAADVVGYVRPNYALARCGTLGAISVGTQASKDGVCCFNFLSNGPGH